jgi:hypothetical protein
VIGIGLDGVQRGDKHHDPHQQASGMLSVSAASAPTTLRTIASLALAAGCLGLRSGLGPAAALVPHAEPCPPFFSFFTFFRVTPDLTVGLRTLCLWPGKQRTAEANEHAAQQVR